MEDEFFVRDVQNNTNSRCDVIIKAYFSRTTDRSTRFFRNFGKRKFRSSTPSERERIESAAHFSHFTLYL